MNRTSKNKSIILLSGGLDSVVSLAVSKLSLNIETALIFDYAQQSFKQEYNAAKNIAEYYNITLKRINIEWLKEFCESSLLVGKPIPSLKQAELDNKIITKKSANAVWIPNRNALFINIAACYAEALSYSNIIIGANKEEARTFKDNSKEFINAINESLNNSTNNNVQVIAPLIDMDKTQIVQEGLKHNVPFELIYSCYSNTQKHCGKCESCLRLKRALELNNRHDIIKKIFT